MKWLFAANKATRCLLNSRQHCFHGYPKGCSHSQKSSMWSKSLLYGHQYNTLTTVNGTEPSYRSVKNGNEKNNKKSVGLDIIGREIIKPASTTSHHLGTYNLSVIDQVFYDCYTPLVLFLPNNKMSSVTDVVNHLKETLSQILTRFYPLAGEVKDNFHIECNDKGVNFMVARVNQNLKEFLQDPNDEKVRELFPESPTSAESSIGNYLIGVQVNIFNCGGIGLSTSISHKIFDGHTYFLFMKAWAAAARGTPHPISPSFVASEVFPNKHPLDFLVPSKLMNTELVSTKRFVFDPMAMASLVGACTSSFTSIRAPTRMEATTALIWRAAAKAARTIRPCTPETPHSLFSFVNIRKRASPPLPYESIGNLVDIACGVSYPESQPDLPTLATETRESIAKVNSDRIESCKGEKGRDGINNLLKRLVDLTDVSGNENHCLFVTSLLNSGIYELDFGWGKPIWFYDMNAGFSRIVALNDTLKGRGVEAAVTLKSDEMEIFERDPELLSYASVNPSPLRFLDDSTS
ncbi:Chloramphenicol acetyltransferase-like domain-containing protein [Artemisia annua]|uniref:Chloramphenicol acetyltransferase-like domain-containing protein n=1 Tax=Artemisia annua TaxID=35608 RepID=A0A2U1MQX6_ARTAN|nr:Chloramphenicol acetyltransferase-like domain-containing protein [Artemisia annua]